jgi:hypothetical protein
MQAQIQSCIANVGVVIQALNGAKRRPPSVVPGALGRLLADLEALAALSTVRPATDPEAAAKARLAEEIQAELAKQRKPAPRAAPVAVAAPRTAKPREPRMPTVPEVVTMLERVILPRPGATRMTGKTCIPVSLVTLAKEWLTEERRHRKALREHAVADPTFWGLLAARTPENLLGVQPGQDPSWMEGQRRAWDLEEQRTEREAKAVEEAEEAKRALPVLEQTAGWIYMPSATGKGSRMVERSQLAEDKGCVGCGKVIDTAHLRSCALSWVEAKP